MKYDRLVAEIKRKRSFLCAGLDPDLQKMPRQFSNERNARFKFCKAIIDSTRDLCVAYKLNSAFFEAGGTEGWSDLTETIAHIGNSHLVILDAKRGDIGNTAKMYAEAAFTQLNADALTLSPYMGTDTLEAYADYKDKWLIVLALTSNPGSAHFEELYLQNNKQLFEEVIARSAQEFSKEQLMFVVGATKASVFQQIRQAAPDHFLLVPGVGSQGGSLKDVATGLMNKDCGILVNASRSIIYASTDENFSESARAAAAKMQTEMAELLAIL